MPSPVGSRLDPSYTPVADPEPLSCGAEPTAADSTACGAESSSWAEPPQGPAPSRGTIAGPGAEAHAGDHDLYAGAFALKGRDAASGVELEVFSVSAHSGYGKLDDFVQSDAHAGMAGIGISSDNGHFNLRGEAFTAHAHLGMQNSDGSIGFNAGLGATAVGVEGTATWGAVSGTVGASVSLNLAGSLGLRDGDHDGSVQVCARAELAVLTVGACIGKFW